MRKILKLNEFVDFVNNVELDNESINESIEELSPTELEALVYNQIIAVEEELVLTEGLKELLAKIANPVTFVKLKSGANKYKKGLISKYKIENEFNDKKGDVDTKEEKDRLDVLKKQKLTAIDDKIKAISDKMDGNTEGKVVLQKVASLMRTKAKIKAADAGIKDADSRAEVIDKLNSTVARQEEALRKAAEQRNKPKETETSVTKTSTEDGKKKVAPAPKAPAAKKDAPAPEAPPAPAASASPAVSDNFEEDAKKEASSMSKDQLASKVRELKSERESDASRLASLKEKITGASVSGSNGIDEKISDAKKKLAKAAESSKPKIQSEIDTLEKEKQKLQAQIADQEKGKALTDKLFTIYSNALQSA